jgi:arylsulfatase
MMNTMGKIVRHLRWVLPILLAIVGGACFLARREAGRSVILITIDTLRADHLSAYGYTRPTSPHLDDFMSRGTGVWWAFSTASSTAPSHASIMLGTYPSFNTIGRLNGVFRLEDEAMTLAELCKSHRMQTAAIVSNPVLKRALGLHQGFDDYDDDLREKELNRGSPEQTAPHALAKALAKLEELRDDSFFLWLHFQDPHGPYTPPPEWVEVARSRDQEPIDDAEIPAGEDESGYQAIPTYQVLGDEHRTAEYVARYDGEIAYLDSHLKSLFERIDALGLLDRTLVAITSDHGEAMGEDDFYFAHGHSVGMDLVRVPLAFVGPGVNTQVLAGPYSNLDIFATVLDFLGIEPPAAMQSVSLYPALRGEEVRQAHVALTEGPDQLGIAFGDLYVRRWRETQAQQVVEMDRPDSSGFDIDDVAQRLDGFDSRSDSAFADINKRRIKTELSPEQLEQLRAIGYVN